MTMRLPARRILVLTTAAMALAAAPAGAAQIYAASSLRDVFPRIDGRQTFNFAGSNQLQFQIERGAPADLFASASALEPYALYRAGRCERPVVFATNVLVLIVPKGNPAGIRSVYDLHIGPSRRLAVGSAGVPVGAYTRRLLARMRISDVLTRNVVSNEPNVAGVVTKVALGSAQAGFVYTTDGCIASRRVRAIRLPTWAQPPIRYEACVVRRPGADTSGARAYLAKVLSARGRRLLHAGGFGLPRR